MISLLSIFCCSSCCLGRAGTSTEYFNKIFGFYAKKYS